jgi:hypothetical protein
MFSLINKNIKHRLRVDGFYICMVLCMMILAVKIYIEKKQWETNRIEYEISRLK